MKRTKKLASLLLALGLTLSLSMPAFAAEGDDPTTSSTATVTLPTDAILTGHVFTAYQIFAGDEADGVLSNVEWGTGIDSTAFLEALKDANNTDLQIDGTDGKVNAFANCTSAADVAGVLGANNTNETLAKAVAKLADQCKTGTPKTLTSGDNTMNDGYYLIVDATPDVGEGGVYNTSLLQVVGNVDITVKTSVPTVEKKVKDINDSDNNDTTNNVWQDSADHDIGDTVSFKLTATLPNNVSAFDTYQLIFHDTMSKGLTYAGNLVVKIGENEIPETNSEGKKNYTITTVKNTDETSDDFGTTALTITFTDVKALGATDNRVVTVEYDATLNNDAVIGSVGNPNTVYLEFSNNPSHGGEGTSKTPDDTVIVFTFKTIVNKVTKNPEYVEGTSDKSEEFIALPGADFELYKFIPKTDGTDEHNSVKGEWTKVERGHDETWSSEITTFTFSGLDDGDYKLHESVTPDGYNTIADIEFTITAEHDVLSTDPKLTTLNGGDKFTGEVSTGILSTQVENNKGTELPTTGGMGTTVLYIAGGTMVAAAGILLITKKRMAK